MATGAKTVETRAWFPPSDLYDQWLLICAAKTRNDEVAAALADERFQEGLLRGPRPLPRRPETAARLHGATLTAEDLWFGHAVALVRLEDCRRTWPGGGPRDLFGSLFDIEAEAAFGDYAPGRYAWRTGQLHRFTPFPVTGRQGLFRVTLPADFDPRPA